ncbi:MAG: hypothetical protein M0R03_02760 [Novosphingobium sp.]|nr:hypothetical protein [Novosphingobium sp.]
MRVGLVLMTVVLLAGCQREKSFDERYAEAADTIGGMARDIDAELTAKASGAMESPIPTASPSGN